MTLALLLTVLLLSCGGDDNKNGKDTTAPSVLYTVPDDLATDVDVSSNVTVYFSELILPSSVTLQSIQLNNGATGDLLVTDSAVVFRSSSDLLYDTTYQAVVTTGITDTAGNHLASEYSWSFRTQADPTTVPPMVTATFPANAETNVDINTSIKAVFSKGLMTSSVSASDVVLTPTTTGSATYANDTVTFIPDAPLAYSTNYAVAVGPDILDTFGIAMASDYVWTFSTQKDPLSPTIDITSPGFDDIIGETLFVATDIVSPAGVDSVVFLLNNSVIGRAYSAPYTLSWPATPLQIGQVYGLSARVYDVDGRADTTESIPITYLWELLGTDPNDPWQSDIRSIYARSTDSTIEFRYEFWEPFTDLFDTIPDDTMLDLGIFIDVDQSELTGRTTFGDSPGIPLNGIGADRRVIIGIHGDTALAIWDASQGIWDLVYHFDGFRYANIPAFSTFLEFGMKWQDIGNPSAIDIVSINVFFQDRDTGLPDWVPDQGGSSLTVQHDDRYRGTVPVWDTTSAVSKPRPGAVHPDRVNPF